MALIGAAAEGVVAVDAHRGRVPPAGAAVDVEIGVEAGVQAAVDGLAERLHRSVTVDDLDLRLIAASRHFGDEDPMRVRYILDRRVDDETRALLRAEPIWDLRAPVRVVLARQSMKPRWCVPIRCGRLLLGFLWLIEDDEIRDEHVADAVEVALAIGLRLDRRETAVQRRLARTEVLLRGLVSSDPASRIEAYEDLCGEELIDDADVVGVAVIACTNADRADVGSRLTAALHRVADEVLRRQPPRSTLVRVRRRGLVLLVSGRRPSHRLEGLADEVVEELRSAAGGRWVAGLGTADGGLAESRLAYDHALTAHRAAQSLPEVGHVVTWEGLGIYGLLATLAPAELDVASYSPALLRLARRRGARQLLRTAETYLDHAGDVPSSAAVLHIHRATLYQRLARIEELSGLRFGNGIDRLALHLGIKLARLTGTYDGLIAAAQASSH